MHHKLIVLFATIITLGISMPALALLDEVTIAHDIILPNDGKRDEETAALTSIVPCTIKVGKYSTNGFTRGGILIEYTAHDAKDREECETGMHFIPRVPVEVLK